MVNNKASRSETLQAVRDLSDDQSIKFGQRWDFEHEGAKFIVRSSRNSKEYDMNFNSTYPGYDYTINIRFIENRVSEFSVIEQPR